MNLNLSILRGNPVALATLLVAVGAAFLAFLLQSYALAQSALIGASVSSIVALVIKVLEEPDLRRVPNCFLSAVVREISNVGYYRKNHRITLSIKENNNKDEITIILITITSDIVPLDREVSIARPRTLPPNGLKLIEDEYSIDGTIIGNSNKGEGKLTEIRNISSERYRIIYQLDKWPRGDFISDDHRWTCPIEDFIFSFRMPAEYASEISLLVGDKNKIIRPEPAHYDEEKIFQFRSAAFSHQGVKWQVSKAVQSQ